ncbi:MAG: DUF2058 domain-containing protein [Gammaproteobacteria bacterium]|nr:DUF2058 domain-containing protein [Gammaproteobacteria bacterium]
MNLQEQLLNAGLVDKKRAAKAKKEKYKKNKSNRQQNNAIVDRDKLEIQKQIAQKKEQDRLLNLEKESAARDKAILAQIKQIIQAHQIKLYQDSEETVSFNFQDGKLIKKLSISLKNQQQIIHGFIAIAKWEQIYYLIPKSIAEKIIERNSSYIVLLNDISNLPIEETEIEDEYADYEIPDDLMW